MISEKHEGKITLSGYEVQCDLRFFLFGLVFWYPVVYSTSMQSLGSGCEEFYHFSHLPVALASCLQGKMQK